MDSNNSIYKNIKKLFQRHKFSTIDLNNQRTEHQRTKDCYKLPPLTTTKNVQINHDTGVNHRVTALPTVSAKHFDNADRLRSNLISAQQYISSPDEFSTLYQSQLTGADNTITNQAHPPRNEILRMSKDSWFEDNNKGYKLNNKIRQHKGCGMMNLDIVTTLRKTSMTTSATTLPPPTTASTMNFPSNNSTCSIRNGCSERGCKCNNNALINAAAVTKKRRKFNKTSNIRKHHCRSAASSSNCCFKVRPYSNLSAVTIWSICEQLQNYRNRKKQDRKYLISSGYSTRNVIQFEPEVDEYLFSLVQRAWHTPNIEMNNNKCENRVRQQAFSKITTATLSETSCTTSCYPKPLTTTSSPSWSPVLTRRRLSVPEIVMRKYALTKSNNNLNRNGDSDESITSSFLPLNKNIPKCRYNNNNNTATNNSYDYRLNSGSDGDLTILQRQHRKQRYDREMRKSTLLKRFWNNRDLQRNHSVEAIYQRQLSSASSTTSMSSASTSPTRGLNATRLRENVLLKNVRRGKFCSTSDLQMKQLIDKKEMHTSTPDITKPADITVTNRVWVNVNGNEIRTEPDKVTTTTQTKSVTTPYFIQSCYKEENEPVKPDPKLIEKLLPEKPGTKPVSNVLGGSIYKPIDDKTDEPLVPRYSAIPRTTSMEVAVSSEENRITEDDSDVASLVDSLEDATSPRPVSSSSISQPVDIPPRRKSAAFFIKIKNDQISITKDDPNIRMPKKILEKIHKRQLAIAKLKKLRNYSKSYTPMEESAFKTISSNSSAITKKVAKPKQQKWLKELETMDSFKIDSQGNMKMLGKENNWTKRAQMNQDVKKVKPVIKPKPNIKKVVTSANSMKPNIGSCNNESSGSSMKPNIGSCQGNLTNGSVKYVNVTESSASSMNPNIGSCGQFTNESSANSTRPNVGSCQGNSTSTRKIYQKTEFDDTNGKHIEILEIVECCEESHDEDKTKVHFAKDLEKSNFKSKIPVPVLPAPVPSSNCIECYKSPPEQLPEITLDQKPVNIMRAMITPCVVNTTDNTTATSDSHPVDRLIASILIGNANEEPEPKPRYDVIPEEEPKIYRTHVTLIMKQQQEEIKNCNCLKNDTKDAQTNTEVKKKPTIKQHSCVDAPPVEVAKKPVAKKKAKAKEIGVQTEENRISKEPEVRVHHHCNNNANCKETQTTTEFILDNVIENNNRKESNWNNRHIHVNAKNNNDEHRFIISENNNAHMTVIGEHHSKSAHQPSREMSELSIQTQTSVNIPHTSMYKKKNQEIRMRLSQPESAYGYHHENPQQQNECGTRHRAEAKRRFYEESDEEGKLTVYKGSSDESDSEGWLRDRYHTYPSVSAISRETKRKSAVTVLPSYRQQHSNWSITVTGTNSNKEQIAPDLKMRLHFPQAAAANKINSDSGIESSNPIQYPAQKSSAHYNSYAEKQRNYTNKNSTKFPFLPNVNRKSETAKATKKQTITDVAMNVNIDTVRKPNRSSRKTASIIRYQQSDLRQHNKASSGKWFYPEEMQLRSEPLQPGTLSICGSTILPEQKPKVPTMSERDLTRNISKIYY